MKPPLIYIVLPAFQAQATLAMTVGEIPAKLKCKLLLVDDGSDDRTADIARDLGLEVIEHSSNRGYGANQKTCYQGALDRGADIVVMLHPDHQYDARAIPAMVNMIESGRADVVLGSRFLGANASTGAMPWWRRLGNIVLTGIENRTLGLFLSEYHSGLRAYSANALRALPFEFFDDGFAFDQQLLIMAARSGITIGEVPARARYFVGASSISFQDAVSYGLRTLTSLATIRGNK